MSDQYIKKTFYIPKATALALVAMAKKEGRSASNMIAIILKQAINNYK